MFMKSNTLLHSHRSLGILSTDSKCHKNLYPFIQKINKNLYPWSRVSFQWFKQLYIYIYIYILIFLFHLTPKPRYNTLCKTFQLWQRRKKEKKSTFNSLDSQNFHFLFLPLSESLSATKGSVEGLIKSHAMCTQTKHLKSCKMHKTTMDNNSQKKKKTSNKAPNLQKSMKYRNRYQQQLISFKPIFWAYISDWTLIIKHQFFFT